MSPDYIQKCMCLKRLNRKSHKLLTHACYTYAITAFMFRAKPHASWGLLRDVKGTFCRPRYAGMHARFWLRQLLLLHHFHCTSISHTCTCGCCNETGPKEALRAES